MKAGDIASITVNGVEVPPETWNERFPGLVRPDGSVDPQCMPWTRKALSADEILLYKKYQETGDKAMFDKFRASVDSREPNFEVWFVAEGGGDAMDKKKKEKGRKGC